MCLRAKVQHRPTECPDIGHSNNAHPAPLTTHNDNIPVGCVPSPSRELDGNDNFEKRNVCSGRLQECSRHSALRLANHTMHVHPAPPKWATSPTIRATCQATTLSNNLRASHRECKTTTDKIPSSGSHVSTCETCRPGADTSKRHAIASLPNEVGEAVRWSRHVLPRRLQRTGMPEGPHPQHAHAKTALRAAPRPAVLNPSKPAAPTRHSVTLDIQVLQSKTSERLPEGWWICCTLCQRRSA